MMETGYGSQVVEVKDHKFLLDETELERILLREEIKDLPVVLVSVAGAYRGGKSFLLNFFLKYLTSPQAAQEDGSWLGEVTEPLEGFSWRSGSMRNTTGILMWSEPIICTLPPGHKAGDKVAVLLMDTQGTFDSSSTVNECSTIFAISTLLASVQIYNLSLNIQEDHLQHLHLFTEYGKLVKEKGNEKAFQVLEFLVRDWPYDWEFAYGYAGGEELLQLRLQINPGMSKELKEVRSHIYSCFEKVTCFLMPHPGKRVTRPDFKGKTNEIDEDFIKYLKEQVTSIFSPNKLEPKVINGKIVLAQDLFTYFKLYMGVFSSGAIPPTASIMKVTTNAGLLTAAREGLKQYENKMDQECGEKAKCVPPMDVKVLHDGQKANTLNSFTQKKKMGTKKDAKPYYTNLSKDIDNRLQQYVAVNAVKQQEVTNAAKKAYDDEIKKISNGELLCVHIKDLQAIHYEASQIAIKAFDTKRKRITDQDDSERDNFLKNLQNKFNFLKVENDKNNKQAIADLREVYWQRMEQTSVADPVFAPAELEKEHNECLADAIESFKAKRNRAHNFHEDTYEFDLVKAIEQHYNMIKNLNRSVNRRAIKAALTVYNTCISSVWDQQNQSLHPEHLEQDHNTAKYMALAAFHPDNKTGDFNPSDEDEVTLLDLLTSRYDELYGINSAMNRVAVQSALTIYRDTYEELARPTRWWLLVIPMFVSLTSRSEFRERAKMKALIKFYKKRRNQGPENTDIYLQEMLREF